MKTKAFYQNFLIGLIIISNFLIFIPSTKSQGTSAKSFTGSLTCDSETIVTDDQWQWYRVVVELGVIVNVNMSYEGDLDVDLRLYWKRNNFPEFNGFDLSHCPLNDTRYNFTINSQFRTDNTSSIGMPEELSFRNPSYTQVADMEAYILVFVYSGIGDSSYTIVSTVEMIKIDDNDVYDCNLLLPIYLTYTITGLVFFTISVVLIKRKKSKIIKSQEQQKKKVVKKEPDKKVIELDTEYKDLK